MRFLLLFIILILGGCKATDQGLSVLSYSNADIESVLQQQLPKLSDNTRLMGIPVEIGVDDIDVNIGPDNRDVIQLGVEASAGIKVLLFNYDAGVTLSVEGSPHYDSTKKAIFLRNVKLIHSSIDAGGFKGDLGVLDKNIMHILNTYLASNPVYKLDMGDPKIALMSRLPLDLKVVEGALRVVPKL